MSIGGSASDGDLSPSPTLIRWMSGDVEEFQVRTIGELRVRVAERNGCFAPSIVVLSTKHELLSDDDMTLPMDMADGPTDGGKVEPLTVVEKPMTYESADWRDAVILSAKSRDVPGLFRILVAFENALQSTPRGGRDGATHREARDMVPNDDGESDVEGYGEERDMAADRDDERLEGVAYKVFSTAAWAFHIWQKALEKSVDREKLAFMRNILNELTTLVYRATKFNRPLVVCAAQKEKFEFVEQLLLANAAVVRVAELNGALHHFAERGMEEVVRILIEGKCDVTQPDSLGCTVLHKASSKGHAAIVALCALSQCGKVTTEKQNEHPDEDACSKDANINYAYINQMNEIGWTPLHCASRLGHVATVRVLLEARADARKGDSLARTALHWSAREGHLEVCTMLLAARAEVRVLDANRKSALDKATEEGRAEVCDILRRHLDDNFSDEMGENLDNEISVDIEDPSSASQPVCAELAGVVQILRNTSSLQDRGRRPPRRRRERRVGREGAMLTLSDDDGGNLHRGHDDDIDELFFGSSAVDDDSDYDRNAVAWTLPRSRKGRKGKKGDAMHGKGDAMYGKGDVVHGKGDAMHGKGNAMHGKGDVMHGKGDAMHGKGYSVYANGGAMRAKGNAMHGKGNAMHGKGGATRGKGDAILGKGGAMCGKGDATRGKGDAILGKGGAMRAKGDAMRGNGDAMRGNGNTVYAKGNAVYAKGNAVYAKAGAMHAKGDAARGKAGQIHGGNNTWHGSAGFHEGAQREWHNRGASSQKGQNQSHCHSGACHKGQSAHFVFIPESQYISPFPTGCDQFVAAACSQRNAENDWQNTAVSSQGQSIATGNGWRHAVASSHNGWRRAAASGQGLDRGALRNQGQNESHRWQRTASLSSRNVCAPRTEGQQIPEYNAYSGLLPASPHSFPGLLPASPHSFPGLLPTSPHGVPGLLPTSPHAYSRLLPTSPHGLHGPALIAPHEFPGPVPIAHGGYPWPTPTSPHGYPERGPTGPHVYPGPPRAPHGYQCESQHSAMSRHGARTQGNREHIQVVGNQGQQTVNLSNPEHFAQSGNSDGEYH